MKFLWMKLKILKKNRGKSCNFILSRRSNFHMIKTKGWGIKL